MTDLFGNPSEPIPERDSEPTHKQRLADSKSFWLRMVAIHGEDSPITKQAKEDYFTLKRQMG